MGFVERDALDGGKTETLDSESNSTFPGTIFSRDRAPISRCQYLFI